VIKGGERLIGEVEVSGSKNATLPIFAASLLAGGVHRFHNVPNLMMKPSSNLRIFQGERKTYRVDATDLRVMKIRDGQDDEGHLVLGPRSPE
jgi:UDP-N-acetylglucosamine enolpyruvyl transferase